MTMLIMLYIDRDVEQLSASALPSAQRQGFLLCAACRPVYGPGG
jgi:hypothetical protein